MIYLDNAATSWPKPPGVLQAMTEALERAGGNPGRSGHRLSIAAARLIYNAREEVAHFFNAADPLRVIFTGNATHSLNLALKGLLKPGDRVVTTSMEHNAVMRPLRGLEKQGVQLDIVPCVGDGTLRPDDLARAINSRIRLVVTVHASNVTGTLMPLAEAALLAHRSGALSLVDAAQTAGVIPIDLQALGVDLLAFTGHKGLLGPPGVGGLVIGTGVDPALIAPLIEGGTGSQSEQEEQPGFLPDRFESGTPNLAGIAGLHAGMKWLAERSVAAIRVHEQKLTQALRDGLDGIPGLRVFGPDDPAKSVAIVSFTADGKPASEIGQRLDEEFGIMTRVGLHCAPAAHRTVGSFPGGTVRLAPGVFTTLDDITQTIRAIREVVTS